MNLGTQPPTTQPAIECRNVWKLFGRRANEAMAACSNGAMAKKDVIDRYGCVIGVADVNLAIPAGEIFCIMGLSGSGKSTLVRHINGLIRPTSGDILINGESISALGPRQLRALRASKIGMVFQNFALLPHRTVIENVAFGLELRKVKRTERMQRAAEMLKLVDLAGWENRFPDELSGGMQQRVGLARALAGNPDILLMDEPFGALDPLIRRQLQDQFIELSRAMRKTTVFITHDLDEAIRIGAKIAIMRDGRVVQIGTPAQIINGPADQYVADFVSGVSELKAIRASDIMAKPAGSPDPAAPKATPDTTLGELAELAAASDCPVSIVDLSGDLVGCVDRTAILNGMSRRKSLG